jgi:hypothetical protein
VAGLGPGQTGIVAGTEVVDVDGGLWRQVRTAGSAVGWVNDAYLAASPVTFDDAARSAMVGTAESAVAWLTGRTDAGQPSEWLSPTGLWIGGIGVYADLPFPSRRVPAADLANQQGWTTPIDFTPPAATAVACGSECVISPLDFVKLPDPDRSYELVVDEVLLADGQAESVAGTVFHNGAVGPLEAMHHVTVDVPATDESLLDWQRIHLFFDWRTGEPRLHAAYTWGWTP